jgi:hypothetical protein
MTPSQWRDGKRFTAVLGRQMAYVEVVSICGRLWLALSAE